MFETISFWIRKSIEICWMIITGSAFKLIFIVEMLIHILPLFGLWDIKSGRKMRFHWIHLPMLCLASLIYAIHISTSFVSLYSFVFFFVFLFPLLSTYIYNLRSTEIWYRKFIRILFTWGDKDKEEILEDELEYSILFENENTSDDFDSNYKKRNIERLK